MAVMTVLALQAIPLSPQSVVFSRRDGLGARSSAGSCALVIRRSSPEPLQNARKTIVFFMPPRTIAVAL